MKRSSSTRPVRPRRFSLGPGGPTNAGLDAASGELSWASTDSDAGTTNTFTVQVADDGVPFLTDATAFSVVVVPRPLITSIALGTNSVGLTWTSVPGQQYRLRYKTNLAEAAWTDLPAGVTASGPHTTGVDTVPATEQRVYQVRLEP